MYTTDDSLIIDCQNVTHYYGNRLIFRDFSFQVQKGKILGLLGKSGTGKSTIINILNGFLRPTRGFCRVLGEEVSRMRPETKGRIGLLLEQHIQHSYLNIFEIEKFYSRFYPNWNSAAYHNLISKLKITSRQPISTMSCGQRSQVALGLLFAQDPEVLILDDFSMGLDPGYRRLFIENLKEFVAKGDKTVFLTSHIIQDMEMLLDDCIMFDYGRKLVHKPTAEILDTFHKFRFKTSEPLVRTTQDILNPEKIGDSWEFYSFLNPSEVKQIIAHDYGSSDIEVSKLSLEDAFIGLTGKY
ncbi:MAG: ABC transporter ATP-binding protein [Bacteroidales bacterium]|nr:ABC transporter ATP-binding protein [Bacteroidales bacterium]